MLLEILERATDLLQEISAISGSAYKVGEDIPLTQQDFNGYVAWWGDATWTQERVNETQTFFDLTMPGYLQSPQLVPGLTYATRKLTLQYAGLITTKFIRRPRLESSAGVPLNGNLKSHFTGGTINVAPYPDGNNQLLRYRCTFTLAVQFVESNPC